MAEEREMDDREFVTPLEQMRADDPNYGEGNKRTAPERPVIEPRKTLLDRIKSALGR